MSVPCPVHGQCPSPDECIRGGCQGVLEPGTPLRVPADRSSGCGNAPTMTAKRVPVSHAPYTGSPWTWKDTAMALIVTGCIIAEVAMILPRRLIGR